MADGFGMLGVRRGPGLLVAAALLAAASAATAKVRPPSSCFNDTDCPNQACGGDVCNWNMMSPFGTPEKPYTCVPAGLAPKGMDGWCSDTFTHEHCKCRAEGAQCLSVYCSFTTPRDAPGGGPVQGGSGQLGGAPTAGSPSAGSPSSVGGASSSSGGTGSAPAPDDAMGRDDTASRTVQACSVRSAGESGGKGSWGVLFLGLGAAFAARRRSAPRIPT